ESARPRRARARGVGGGARQPCPGDVHLVHHVLEPVVGLADRGRGERVRRRDVGPSVEVRTVDLRDQLRLRQVEEIGIALDVARMVAEALAAPLLLPDAASLEQDAPGAVEDEAPLLPECPEISCDVSANAHLACLKRTPSTGLARAL